MNGDMRLNIKAKAIRIARQLHQCLVWIALTALVLFVLSALAHPLMTWTGPQSEKFSPPSTQVSRHEITQLLSMLPDLDTDDIRVGKIVPSERGPLLQITRDELQSRDYYLLTPSPLATPVEPIADFDRQQAAWLARYYSGIPAPIKSIDFVTAFSTEYPPVNRLLPVYKVVLDTENQLTLFVHTETGALAAINNNWKKTLQTLFQLLHTWSWLDGLPLLRVGLILALLISLLTATISGIVMLALIRRRQPQAGARHLHSRHIHSRYVHRKLAWLLAMPLIGLLISGIYHLLQSEYGELPSGMRLSEAVHINPHIMQIPSTINNFDGAPVNNVTLVPHQQRLWLRASLAPAASAADHDHGSMHKIRKARFDGQSVEAGALWLALDNSEQLPPSDRTFAEEKARDYLQLDAASTMELSLVTHFGPDYDFRNKRLPVWQVASQRGDLLFVDPATGILVEHVNTPQRLERLSFSMLHKWNMLVPLLGREGRDVLVVVFLVALLGLGYLGWRIKCQR